MIQEGDMVEATKDCDGDTVNGCIYTVKKNEIGDLFIATDDYIIENGDQGCQCINSWHKLGVSDQSPIRNNNDLYEQVLRNQQSSNRQPIGYHRYEPMPQPEQFKIGDTAIIIDNGYVYTHKPDDAREFRLKNYKVGNTIGNETIVKIIAVGHHMTLGLCGITYKQRDFIIHRDGLKKLTSNKQQSYKIINLGKEYNIKQ